MPLLVTLISTRSQPLWGTYNFFWHGRIDGSGSIPANFIVVEKPTVLEKVRKPYVLCLPLLLVFNFSKSSLISTLASLLNLDINQALLALRICYTGTT